ncbi:glycosyltransferase [Pontibacter diazotrophicus]|uniref:Glycosyltransferase n=1 Tax=Pontibacter diazotrophicus TaxID=1400979 RepID=A0A3D8LBU9_9BACT|nr:glycosyltransferase [Pontibacter diazotrophicus]RDV14867.1 glycosyltransferase [Pontibacter diazotrophicus]
MNTVATTSLFSVLIANYNNGKYLLEAVESVRQQTYLNWEIIIVDDASTDESSIIYEQIREDSRISIAYNTENKGCGYTKRRCIELAKGDLCGFLDPDDALHPQAIEEMVKKHISMPESSLVYSTHIICDENLRPVLSPSSSNIYNSTAIPEKQSHLTSKEGNISHFASFKKMIYLRTSGIDSQLKRAVDQDLYYKLEEQGDVLYIDKILYYYRHHSNSISLNENSLKAQYWNLVAVTNAYERRIENFQIPNITKHTLEKKWLAYFLKKALFYSKQKNWAKMYINLLKSGKYIKHDTKLSIIRIGLSPVKQKFYGLRLFSA